MIPDLPLTAPARLRSRLHLRRLLALLWAISSLMSLAWAGVVAFQGASSADLTRGQVTFGLTPSSGREYVESYSLWMLLQDGTFAHLNLPVTNISGPLGAAVELVIYPASGGKIEAGQEFPSGTLQHSATGIRLGDNRFRKLPDGRFALDLDVPLTKGGGRLEAHLQVTPTLPAFRLGDGRVRYPGGKHFELALLFPRGTLSGTWGWSGRVVPVQGQAYGDRCRQDLWAHYVAKRWFSWRFFSPQLYVASTSLTLPAQSGGQTLHQILLADGQKLLHASSNLTYSMPRTVRDEESGYPVPRQVRLELQDGGWGLSGQVDLPAPLDRRYLFANVNPVVRGVLNTFVARPYAWRFRAPASLSLTAPGGTPTTHRGTLILELIHVTR